jgi:hypothetical protein
MYDLKIDVDDVGSIVSCPQKYITHSDFFQILNKNCNSSTAKGLRAECHPRTKIKDAMAGISHMQQNTFGLFPNRVGKPKGPCISGTVENDYVITRCTST